MSVEEIFTPEEFDVSVLRAGDAVVLFLADWCGYCLAFRPSFERAAASEPMPFVLVRLDDEGNRLWDEWDIRVVPTLAYVRAGVVVVRQDGHLGQGIAPSEFDEFLRRVRALRAAAG